MDHGEGAEPPRRGQDVQELLVTEAESLVGHVDLERGDPLRDQPGQVLAERLLGRVREDQMERIVDHRLRAGAAVVVLDDGPELHPAVLRREGDHGGGAAEGRGHGAGVKIVGAHDPGRGELVDVDVAVDAAGEDVEAAGIDLPAPGRQPLAERRDPPAVDPDVAAERLGRRDDGAAPDDELVGHGAGIIAPVTP
jgi:hypothetical protein